MSLWENFSLGFTYLSPVVGVVIMVVMVSFVSAQLSLQAAASRLLFAYARDDMIVGSKYLARLRPGVTSRPMR
jgi:amino acid transporter